MAGVNLGPKSWLSKEESKQFHNKTGKSEAKGTSNTMKMI